VVDGSGPHSRTGPGWTPVGWHRACVYLLDAVAEAVLVAMWLAGRRQDPSG
jgi:hypothetical protein